MSIESETTDPKPNEENSATPGGDGRAGDADQVEVDENRPSYPVTKMRGGEGESFAREHGQKQSAATKIPPQDVEAERVLLGCMMLESETIDGVRETLGRLEAPFYTRKNQAIYDAIADLYDAGEAVDLSTVGTELRGREVDVSTSYLVDCTTEVASPMAAETLARVVAECAMKRRLIEVTNSLTTKAYEDTSDVFDLMDEAEAKIIGASRTLFASSGPASSSSAVQETLEHLENIQDADDGVTGVPSGFNRLDELTAGWQDSDLVIVAGRPSMGKTSFALCSALNAAKEGVPVAIFSLEMSRRQLMQRMITGEARVDAQKARKGRVSDDEWQRVARAAGKISELPLFIDDTPSITPLEMRAKVRRLKSEEDVGLVVVDYLGMMGVGSDGSSARRIDTREQEVAHISRSLKGLAKELDLPVMALVQLNRAVESRGGEKRPQLSDLRDSGRIEQDADVVAFIYRAERYGITTDKQERSTEGIAEVMVEKQRNGPVGTATLAFVKQYARFENLTIQGEEEGPDEPF